MMPCLYGLAKLAAGWEIFLAALNANNAQPLAALKGTNPTQVATGSVTVPLYTDTSGASALLQTVAAGYPVVPWSRITYDTALGAVLGIDLVDTLNTAAAWVVYGTNTKTDDSGAVKITFVDSSSGAYTNLNAAGGLIENLPIWKRYTLTGMARVSAGNSVDIYDDFAGVIIATITSTTNVPFSYTYTSDGSYKRIRMGNMVAGEIIWLSGMSVREITPAYLPTDSLGNALATPTTLASGLVSYAGGNAANPGLAVIAEPAATNLHLNSGALSGYATDGTGTWAADQTTSPFGDNLADKFTEAATTAIHYTYVVITSVGAAQYTASCYMKEGTRRYGGLFIYNAASCQVIFDLNMGVVTAATGTYSPVGKMEYQGNGWWRCIVTFTSSITGAQNFGLVTSSNGTTTTTVGSAYIYAWGSQLETGAVATTYTPTGAGAVTRPPRYSTIPGTNLGNLIRLKACLNSIGTEQWLIGDPTSLAGLYINSANKIVWRGVSMGAELITDAANRDFSSDTGFWTKTGVIFGGTAVLDPNEYFVRPNFVSEIKGVLYKIEFDFTTEGGAPLIIYCGTTSSGDIRYSQQITTGGRKTVYLLSAGVNGDFKFGATAVVGVRTVDNITVKEVKELTSTSTVVAGTPVTIGMKQDATGAWLAINGTDEDDDNTMQTEVTWGATVRLGADTAATAGSVLNGSVSLIHSGDTGDYKGTT